MEPKFVKALAELLPHRDEESIRISVFYRNDGSIDFMSVDRFHSGVGENSWTIDKTQGFNIHYSDYYKNKTEVKSDEDNQQSESAATAG